MISMVWDLIVDLAVRIYFNQTKLDGFCFVDNLNNDKYKNVVAIQQDAKKIISCSVRIWTEKKLQKLTNKNMAVYYLS